MRTATPVGLVAAVTLAATVSACSRPAPPPRACTLIGCEDGLAVVVEGTPPAPYRIEARAGGGPARVHECRTADACSQVLFAGLLPAEVTVTVSGGGATVTETVRPEVSTLQPNGPGCPPTCRQARVTLRWPAGATGAASPAARSGGAAAGEAASEELARTAVTAVVERFGGRLGGVSLLAPEEVLRGELREQYGPLVTPALLARWLASPREAPGREVSSPWPQRVEVDAVEPLGGSRYAVRGDVVLVTSAELATGGAAAREPVRVEVERQPDGRWLIAGWAAAPR